MKYYSELTGTVATKAIDWLKSNKRKAVGITLMASPFIFAIGVFAAHSLKHFLAVVLSGVIIGIFCVGLRIVADEYS